jgi:DNA-binding NtrC family response regulator
MTKFKAFIIDDDKEMRASLMHLLANANWTVEESATAIDVEKKIAEFRPDVILSDVRMPGRTGTEFLEACRALDMAPIILMSAHGDIPMAVNAIKTGAYGFLEKPFDPIRLLQAMEHAAQQYNLVKSSARLKARLSDLSGLDRILLGNSDFIKDVKETIIDFSEINSTILIHGATGTGKELVAKAIHDLSGASDTPFIAMNCVAIAVQDFEAVTFGQDGIISKAESGTLFLDEITSAPIEIQAKLSRFLETKEYTPLGSSQTVTGNIRIITATSDDPAEALKTGDLREDFYYRISGLTVKLPNLQQQRDDIPLLFEHFTNEFGRLYEVTPAIQSAGDISALISHSWPGNVRELRSVAERCVLAARRGGGGVAAALNADNDVLQTPENLRGAVATFERTLIIRAIQSHSGRMDDVAEALGIGRRTLNEKIVKLNIDKADIL